MFKIYQNGERFILKSAEWGWHAEISSKYIKGSLHYFLGIFPQGNCNVSIGGEIGIPHDKWHLMMDEYECFYCDESKTVYFKDIEGPSYLKYFIEDSVGSSQDRIERMALWLDKKLEAKGV